MSTFFSHLFYGRGWLAGGEPMAGQICLTDCSLPTTALVCYSWPRCCIPFPFILTVVPLKSWRSVGFRAKITPYLIFVAIIILHRYGDAENT